MIVFTTDAVRPEERFDYWREMFGKRALECRMEPVRGQPLHGEVRAEAIGDLTISRYVGGVIDRYRRGRVEISRSPMPFYFAHFQLQGSGFFLRGKQEIAMSAGDAIVAGTVNEFEMGFPGRPSVALVVRIPREWIAARVRRPELVHGTLIRRDQPLSRLLRSYLESGQDSATQLTADAAALYAQHVAELLSHAIGEAEPAPASPQAWREALFVRACRLITLAFGDSALTPDAIAAKLGISTRLLQKIFAERGATVMQRLWDERVGQAARLLSAKNAAPRSITDIAFSCGFNDSAHFTRAFSSRMGMTPSQWRRGQP